MKYANIDERESRYACCGATGLAVYGMVMVVEGLVEDVGAEPDDGIAGVAGGEMELVNSNGREVNGGDPKVDRAGEVDVSEG
jgi:hypothetical protein